MNVWPQKTPFINITQGFSLTHSTASEIQLLLYSSEGARRWSAPATNLKQLPHWMRPSGKYSGGTEAGQNWLKRWQCILLEQQALTLCYAWLLQLSCFSRVSGERGVFLVSWPVVKCVGARLKIAQNHRKNWSHGKLKLFALNAPKIKPKSNTSPKKKRMSLWAALQLNWTFSHLQESHVIRRVSRGWIHSLLLFWRK